MLADRHPFEEFKQKRSFMALRPTTKIKTKESPEAELPRDPAHQRKKSEERFWLQVDRQTKGSYPTLEAAEAAGGVIKTAHPVVQVSIYDSVDCTNTIIGAAAEALS
jgi:hypothetical protein